MFWIMAVGLVIFVSIINTLPSSPFVISLVAGLNDDSSEYYYVHNATIDEACLDVSQNSSIDSWNATGRAFVNITMGRPIYVVDERTPTLTVFFSDWNDSSVSPIRFSMKSLWGAISLSSTPTNVSLQFIPYQDTIEMEVVFSDFLCDSLVNLYPNAVVSRVGSDSLDLASDQIWYLTLSFSCIIVLPFLASFALQGKHICIALFRTWDYWDAFDSFTKVGPGEGVWIIDHQLKCEIDFTRLENCHTWFEFRKLLIQITSINMRFAIPLLRIAVAQFVLSTAAIFWNRVNGSAPYTGFLFLLCLCVNSLATLVLLYPLHNIWIIQSSHVPLICEKYLQAEALPLSDDHRTMKRQRHVTRLLLAIKIGLESCDERVTLLGFEVSYGFLWTLGTFAVSGFSFLSGGSGTN